ncbi:MAG: DUF2007 domain-containing protein [Methylotenera sp.]|jgi:Putative prokaryotic signal transducing protein
MITIYHAANSLDAYMIKGLLEQYGIQAYVQGEYLQGGIGELPTFGLVSVTIDDEHQLEAKKIIMKWESATIIEEETITNHVGGELNASF